MRLAIAVAVTALVLPMGVASANRGDDTIDLPAGFLGEGVAVGRGNTFYAGSRADGRIARGDLRQHTSEVWVSDPAVAPAIGLGEDVRHGLLWVAGGPSGQAAVYDVKTAEPVADEPLTLTTDPSSFVNDVEVTRDAAYFTNSMVPELYRVPVSARGRVGEPETIPLTGPAREFVEGFNLNGIEATPDGRTLIVVNSATGELFTVDPATGTSARIDLDGETVRSGDGLLLHGRTLYVLQNGSAPPVANQIAVIRLSRDLGSGAVVDTITSPRFQNATTLARRGNLLVAVNANFAAGPIDPEPEVVLLRAHG